MPRIFDNLARDSSLLPALQETLGLSSRADICFGYFNFRGWGGLAPLVDRWPLDDGPCRILIGMQRLPHDDLRDALSLVDKPSRMDSQTAHRLRVQPAEQLRTRKVVVKPLRRYPLHAKCYLVRDNPSNPIVGRLGSRNLTFAGLAGQDAIGERRDA